MSTRSRLRVTATLTGSALVLSAALATSPAYAVIPAPAGADPAPAADGGDYLAAQLNDDDLITAWFVFPEDTPPQSYTDYGLTIDVGFALDAVGGQDDALDAMTDALEADIGNYAFAGGSKAKISAFLLSQGVTSSAVNEVVSDIEDNHISTSGPTTGRLQDADDPETPYDDDFNSPLTQAFAVSALSNANSPLAASALSFLLDQQCAAGFFRGSFSNKSMPDQTCDGAVPPASGSVDTTGLALIMLEDQKSKPVVAAAIDNALDWLETQQGADGSFGGNANRTGLAGWALGLGGRDAAAAKAAASLRSLQLANAGTCTPFAAADDGAVVLDEIGYAEAADGMDEVENSTATRATAQALPALLWAPGGANAGETTATGPDEFVKAGTTQTVALSGAPGDTLCVSASGTDTTLVLPESGLAQVEVDLPARTRTLEVGVVDAGGEVDTVQITGLKPKSVPFSLPRSVESGDRLKVKVKGLEPGERVVVKFRGRKVAETVANGKGKKAVRFVATGRGPAEVKVKGEFGNRKNTKVVTVRR